MTEHRRPLPPPPAPRGGSGCLVILGGILLLPGACALMAAGSDLKGMLTNPSGLVLVVIGLAISAGGLVLMLRQ